MRDPFPPFGAPTSTWSRRCWRLRSEGRIGSRSCSSAPTTRDAVSYRTRGRKQLCRDLGCRSASLLVEPDRPRYTHRSSQRCAPPDSVSAKAPRQELGGSPSSRRGLPRSSSGPRSGTARVIRRIISSQSRIVRRRRNRARISPVLWRDLPCCTKIRDSRTGPNTSSMPI